MTEIDSITKSLFNKHYYRIVFTADYVYHYYGMDVVVMYKLRNK